VKRNIPQADLHWAAGVWELGSRFDSTAPDQSPLFPSKFKWYIAFTMQSIFGEGELVEYKGKSGKTLHAWKLHSANTERQILEKILPHFKTDIAKQRAQKEVRRIRP
jgi:aspartate-semialdehyde dehydrogenase